MSDNIGNQPYFVQSCSCSKSVVEVEVCRSARFDRCAKRTDNEAGRAQRRPRRVSATKAVSKFENMVDDKDFERALAEQEKRVEEKSEEASA